VGGQGADTGVSGVRGARAEGGVSWLNRPEVHGVHHLISDEKEEPGLPVGFCWKKY